MRLYIDAGNTRIKWCLLDERSVVQSGACDNGDAKVFAEISSEAVDHIAVSTVISDEARKNLALILQSRFGVVPVFHWPEPLQCGVQCAYAQPELLGADRWHALIGARAITSSALVVVDAGSAITVDFLDSEGVHLGGYILPGKRLMEDSLKTNTARVNFGQSDDLRSEPGRSTESCVRHGLNWLFGGLGAKLEADCQMRGIDTVYLTGGDAHLMSAAGMPGEVVPELVLSGLVAVDLERAL
ncbi:type III pantothenate kinase [Marinobacter sp. BGYM27]|uniref:type III pantothenate kinase n=1 Tax=Marinobacter sp. BGYM27 TaxID=2975597 RepID=UPI0021A31536|nr:type III pantothenate kinase [Marinobacter sp. BGYM27]MDG5500880.1 type III pantothenate kinase [Marinobacter sp. BGYM27]